MLAQRADAVDESEAGVTIAALDVFADAVQFIGDNAGLMWDKTLEHLACSAAAVAVALVLAVPVGVGLGHLRRYSFVAISISNIGRALPTLAVIAVLVVFLPVGSRSS